MAYKPLHRELNGQNIYRIYFVGQVLSTPGEYATELEVLNAATVDDIVEIYFNSQGGNLGIAVMLADHITSCRGTTIGIIGFECASSASMMALRCDAFRISALSTMMAHAIEYGVDGDAPRQWEYAGFMKALSNQYINETYKNLLTHEELIGIIHHSKTVDLNANDLSIRLKRVGVVTVT